MSGATAKIRERVKTGKLLEVVIVIILLVIVAAIVLMGFDKKTEQAEGDYARELEQRLSAVLSRIEGEVAIFITVGSDGEKVLASESIVAQDGTVTTIPVFSGGEPVVLEEKSPEITGVLIVSEGAYDLSVRFNLLEATASVLNINQSIIKVYTMGGNS